MELVCKIFKIILNAVLVAYALMVLDKYEMNTKQ